MYFFASSMTPDNKPHNHFPTKILQSRAEDHQRFSGQHFVQGDFVIPTTRPPVVLSPINPPDQKTSQGVPGSAP